MATNWRPAPSPTARVVNDPKKCSSDVTSIVEPLLLATMNSVRAGAIASAARLTARSSVVSRTTRALPWAADGAVSRNTSAHRLLPPMPSRHAPVTPSRRAPSARLRKSVRCRAMPEGASSQPSRFLTASWRARGAGRGENTDVSRCQIREATRSAMSFWSRDVGIGLGCLTRYNYLMINVTETAASKITELLAEENKLGAGLRVFVQGGGCSG